MADDKPAWDDAFGIALVGKLVLVGITRHTAEGVMQEQVFGTVETADAHGIELVLGGKRSGDRFGLPPDPRAFQVAQPGTYRLRSSRETLTDPDYTAVWTVEEMRQTDR